MKDDIQELVFSNSQLHVKRFASVLVSVMTPLGTSSDDLYPIIENLGNSIEERFKDQELDFITPEVTEKVDSFFDEWFTHEFKLPAPPSQKPRRKLPKIVVAGLRKAGKTTAIRGFFDSWNKEQLDRIRPTVDYSIFNSFIDVLKTELTIFDLGGQTEYVKKHVYDEFKWKNLTALIFMVDIQNPAEFEEAYIYLTDIMNVLKAMKESPFIGLLAHKYDPNKVSELQPNLLDFLKAFKGLFIWPRYSVFLSSILDDSLYLAFMRILARMIPQDLLINVLRSSIFFETQNHVWKTLSGELAPESDSKEFWKKIKALSVPYGESLANNIFRDWLSGNIGKMLDKPVHQLIGVEISNIAGGMQVDIEIPREGSSLLIIGVIEGLLTGLGNVFGFSRIIRIHVDQQPRTVSASWGLYEF
ncbi:MAG: ADP-ribosylation factor-like protein [Candidatus Thorarchaeota archaeon]